jgi:Type VI secretion system VasI, EvfG, VC_A0118
MMPRPPNRALSLLAIASLLIGLFWCSRTDADEWTIKRDISPLNHVKQITGVQLAAEASYDKYGNEFWPSLLVRCVKNRTEAAIVWQIFLHGRDSQVQVATRLDDAPATTELWDISTDKRATFTRHPIAWLRQLLTAHSLSARVTSSDGEQTDATFDLDGLQAVAAEVAETCHWKPAPCSASLRCQYRR